MTVLLVRSGVNILKNRFSKVDPKFLRDFVGFLIITLACSCSPIDMFNDVIQEGLYPFSKYPVVVHTSGQLIMLPGFVLMWVIVMSGINYILLTIFEKKFFKVFKEKLVLFLVATVITTAVVFVLDIIVWPISAVANGYFPCPYDTLLFGSKMSTAWSKKEAYCYDKGVQARLTTGTFEQVVQVAKYLEDKKQ